MREMQGWIGKSSKFFSRPSHASASHTDGSNLLGFRLVLDTCLTDSLRLVLINCPRSCMSNVYFLISFHSSYMISLPTGPDVPGGVSSSPLSCGQFRVLLSASSENNQYCQDPTFSRRSEANSSKTRNNTHTCPHHPNGNRNIPGFLQCLD
jgi:hypothetical protein